MFDEKEETSQESFTGLLYDFIWFVGTSIQKYDSIWKKSIDTISTSLYIVLDTRDT